MSDEIIDGFFGEHGLSPADRAWLRARAVGQPLNTYTDPAPNDLNAVTAIPRTYVVCTGDLGDPVAPPAHRAGRSTPLASGHWPMTTKPTELAELLHQAARP